MLLRSLIAGALALAVMPPAAAEMRPSAYARLECVGLYCRVVPVPPPRDAQVPVARGASAKGSRGR
jgi:hypothetical protein